MSVKNRLILLIVLTGLFVSICTVGLFVWKFKEEMYNQKKLQVEYLTEAAVNIAKMYNEQYKTNKITLKEAQDKTIKTVNNMSYDGKNYIWINDYDGIMLEHPKAELIGNDFNLVKDKKGKLFVPELIESCKKTGIGFTEYYWTKPGHPDSELFLKFSVARGFEEWKWMFASGVYVDDVQAIIFKTIMNVVLITFIILIALIFVAYFTIAKSIINPIEKLTGLSHKLADNDLTIEIPDDKNPTEIGELNRSFKKFTENFKELLKNVAKSVEEVTSGSQQVSTASNQTAQGAQQVAQSVTQLASGAQEQAHSVNNCLQHMNSINSSVQTIADASNSTVDISKQTSKSANDGKKQAEIAVKKINMIKETSTEISETINGLGRLSSEIEQIVDLIKTIASQTNLLALNAAIEAARAGEQGKGFAVVAEEVKKLAGESATATDKITEMVKEIQVKTGMAVSMMQESVVEVEDGVSAVETTGKALQDIYLAATATTEQIDQISEEVKGLLSSSDNVVRLMENIASVTEETAASNEEISSISEEQTASLEEINASTQILAKIAVHLQELVMLFKL